MATIVGIGVGLFILIFIWVISLFLCVALSRAQGSIANAAVGIVLVAFVLTLVLWFFPRGLGNIGEDFVIYDYNYNTRTAIVSSCGVMLIVGLVILVPLHCFEAQLATPLKARRGLPPQQAKTK